jgi:dipeptidyl aminopeptidase/acylaminoacyl peptidase
MKHSIKHLVFFAMLACAATLSSPYVGRTQERQTFPADKLKDFRGRWGEGEFDLSADGSVLAFLSTSGMGSHKAVDPPSVWVKVLASGEMIRMPGIPNDNSAPWPRLSPDGSRLAYMSKDKEGDPVRVHVWSRATRKDRVFDRLAATGIYDFQWAPDGKRVYAVVEQPGARPSALRSASTEQMYMSGSGRVLFKDSANRGITVLESPEKQSDNLLLREYLQHKLDVVALDVETGNVAVVLTAPMISRISIAPDGSAMLVEVGATPDPKTPQAFKDFYVVPLTGNPSARSDTPLSKSNAVTDGQGNPLTPIAPRLERWMYRGFSWSPSSDRIALTTEGPVATGDLFIIDVKRRKVRNVTEALKLPADRRDSASGRNRHDFHGKFGDDLIIPVWSRDGKTVYLRRMHAFDKSVDRWGMRGELWSIDAITGDAKQLTPANADFSIEGILNHEGTAWTGNPKDDDLLLAVRFGGDDASGSLRFNPKTGQTKTIARFRGDATRGVPMRSGPVIVAAAKGNLAAFLDQRSDAPPELYTLDVVSGKIAQVTDVNHELAVSENVAEQRLVTWTMPGGERAGGFLYLPPKRLRPPGVKLPIVMHIYPGNDDYLKSIRDERYVGWAYYWNGEFHQLFDAGYAVFEPDVPFRDGHSCEDITANTLAALDAAGATGLVDVERAGVMGTSFGGYSVNCVVTHTGRFRAAVSKSGISDVFEYAFKSGLSGGGQARLGQGIDPWKHRDVYIANSPIYHSDKVTTPLLLLHGKMDEVCPYPQSLSFFRALQGLRKTAVLVGYDDEGHGIENPDWKAQLLKWFDRYLKSGNDPKSLRPASQGP